MALPKRINKRSSPWYKHKSYLVLGSLFVFLTIVLHFAVQGLLMAKPLVSNDDETETPPLHPQHDLSRFRRRREKNNMAADDQHHQHQHPQHHKRQHHWQNRRHQDKDNSKHHGKNHHHHHAGPGGKKLSSHVETAAAVQMPRLIYGCAWKEDRTAHLVQLALRHGFRGIDTAAQPKHYNEKGAGDGLSAFLGEQSTVTRKDLFVQTKFNRKHAPTLVEEGNDNIHDHVRASVAASLQNLQVSYLDSLVMHSPYANMDDTLTAWDAMEKEVDAGNAKQLGISNVPSLQDLKTIYKHARIKPAVVQLRFHRKTGFEREMRAWCADHNVYFQSFWTLTANSREGQRGKDAVLSTIVRKIAQKHHVSPQVMFYRWVMSDGVTCPLDGTNSEEHMDEDLKAIEIPLSDEDRDAISDVVYRGLPELYQES